tara:strand:- start:861 stop:1298 length:438 start_codon:yes stop_codon:yes gene_type:complete
MNQLQKYYTEDLEQVELQGVTFHVKLPGSANKRFQRAVLTQVVEQDENGEFVARDTPLDQMVEAQVNAFVRTCIRQVDGWDDYTAEALLAMPDACEDLWQAVVALNAAKELEADAIAKKPVSTSDGQQSGRASQSSTPDLKSAAG